MFASIAGRLGEIHESHARRRTLHRELAAITSPETLADLEAAISRCEAAGTGWQTQEMRRALAEHRSALAR